MKSYEFINEAEIKPYKYENVLVKNTINMLKTHCQESLSLATNPIWRGMANHKRSVILIDPSTGERSSENTSNHFTQLVSNSPYYKNWPARNKSLICTTSGQYASHYGSDVFAIFPFDGVKIAVCPGHDIWATDIILDEFDKDFTGEYGQSIPNFNNWLVNNFEFPPDYASMQKIVADPDSEACLFAKKFGITGNKILPLIHKSLSPKNLKFKLLTIPAFAAKKFKQNEC